MKKSITLKNSNALLYVKSTFIGILVSLIGLLAFALVMKFVVLSDNVVSAVNQGIKAVSIFISVKHFAKFVDHKLPVHSLIIGLLYSVLAYLVFSVLSGSFVFNLGTLSDLLFATLTAFICGIIVKLIFTHK